MKNGTTIDFFVLIIFFFILVGIGFYFSKLMKSGKDYFSGGNKVPWWASGISMFTASFSAWSFTGAAGFVYQTEWLGIFYFATWSVGCIIGSYMTAARWRRTRGISPVEYTKTRYNQVTQQVIGYVILLNAILSLGIGLTAVSKIISYSMNIPIEVVIIVSGAAVLVYTFLGGIWAVTVADVLKFFIIIGITIIILPLALNLVGGFGPLLNGLSKINLDQTYKGEGYNFTWIMSIILINIFTSANSAQKFYSVRDEKSARKVGLMCGLLFLAVPLLFGVPPLVAKILWPDLSKIAAGGQFIFFCGCLSYFCCYNILYSAAGIFA
jgi:Na+/proline symporter